MLLSRVLTALILLPLAVYAIVYVEGLWFTLILSLVFVVGAHEWTRITAMSASARNIFIVLVVVSMLFLDRFFSPLLAFEIAAAALVFWALSFIQIIRYPLICKRCHQTIGNMLRGWWVLVPAWLSMLAIKQNPLLLAENFSVTGGWLLLGMMVLIWGADTGAYFSGRLISHYTRFRLKLLPQVSPGKTWAGALGALVCGILISLWAHDFYQIELFSAELMIIASMVLVAVSIVGDLYESLQKRHSGIKDSGHILPGHGGILDRIDSLTSTAPFFYVMIAVMV